MVDLGGAAKFDLRWDPRGECDRNCSFVSGDVAAAFWTVAPPAWRALAYGVALAFGTVASLWRVAAGAHFLTDAVFSGMLTFLTIWVMHGVMIRWPRTRLTEEEADGAIEHVSLWWREAVRDLFRKPRTDP